MKNLKEKLLIVVGTLFNQAYIDPLTFLFAKENYGEKSQKSHTVTHLIQRLTPQ